jgi:predicted RND superfamily exporter protein
LFAAFCRSGTDSKTGERVAWWVLRNPWPCLLAGLCLTLLAGWHAKDLQVDNAIGIWFAADDPGLIAYRDFQQRFGNDEIVVVAFHDSQGTLNPRVLHLVQRASRALAAVDGVAWVDSLATLPRLRASRRGLEAVPLLAAEPPTAAQADALRDAIEDAPRLASRLVSADRTTTVVLAQMETLADMDDRRATIIADMNAALEALGVPYRMIGIGVIYQALNQLSTVDSGVLIVAAYFLTACLLWLFYGRLTPTLVTLAVVGTAVVWTMGAYAAAGRDINMVTMVIPTLVTVVGVANCIHILRHVARMPPSANHEERVVKGVGFMFRPCLFTTLTTATGFAALAASPLPVIRDLGMFSAAGLVVTFVLTIVFCTWALAWVGAEPRAVPRFRLRTCTTILANTGIRRGTWVLTIAGLLTLVAGVGLSRLDVDTDPIDFMFADHPVRQDYREVERRFDGYTPLEFVVRGDDGVLRPEVFAAVAGWQRAVEAQAAVGWSYSVVDWLGAFDPALAASASIGDNPEATMAALQRCCADLAAQLSTLVDPPEALRVTFVIHIQSARIIARIIEQIVAEAHMPPGVSVTAAGYLPLYVRMVDHIVSSQIRSFALALIVIFAALAVLFRSLSMALLSLPGNLLPVLLTLGAMGLLGVRLDVATVTIAAIVLGIVVDDTVLFLYFLRHEQRRHASMSDALSAAVDSAGQSILITTLALGLGFLVYGLAEVKSIVWFGVFVSFAMVSALLADLMLLPALIMRGRSRFQFGQEAPAAQRLREREHAR